MCSPDKGVLKVGVHEHCPSEIREASKFLIDEFGYRIDHNEELFHDTRPYGYVLEYSGNDRRVSLIHDYRDEFFDFRIIRGLDTPYPNDSDLENIVSFRRLFRSFDPSLDPNVLQPRGEKCVEAALLNAQLLRKYAADILKGNKWV
jgi:hypothetical protein